MLTEQQMLIAEVAFTSGQSNGYANAKGLEPEISVDDWLADPELQIELSEALSDIPALTYTIDPPTDPGWYWTRFDPRRPPEVVQVALGPEGSLSAIGLRALHGIPISVLRGWQWSRIPEPKP